ncbi:hypothetical protein COCC4DRAFT_51902 [Bipolaris maydis ATCC 48331]|uniref:Uncharacterized protein n=2 Tax=Cochliobolus heterostrophus TaxID=5016 RepID=M2U1U3_COCH5|nr:uncharacterized protein COCC4DRAFT_51902 [Bipolaris maydis ATCC 48331]EMD88006.1 hypothetical protein COCHEDRAFT_1227260 [Bipolaris maydis C5]KAH7552233.1 hypothetical protein BM1_09095 [Bipolaris maydis]ENI03521.1 hypothetical protein COCC4DRAFT_51902 [Bipolaris maydis ATCC 48331]KAJ5024274.1 ankyrin repeat-containing domain protein [Bipolaris maydis]KAJ6268502.1 ankyrin repeat-containing domain protein [Bipolaris maydis]
MDPLSITASIIAVLQLSVKVLGYFNDVKNASNDQAKCAVEASNIHSLLTKLRFRLEEGKADAQWCTAVRALGVENGPLDQVKQALKTLQTHMTDRGRLRQALVWKFKKEEIAGILDRIERLKTLILIALEMDHFKLSQAIKGDTNFIRARVSAIQSGVDQIQQGQADAKHNKIVEWISPMNYPAQQSDIISRRQEGTGQWFLDAPEFARWLGEPKGRIFCPGIPGAGKTMVAAIAIDHLLHSTQNRSIGVAYVYCNYQEQNEQNASSMLAAIVKQLVQNLPPAAKPVELLHQKHHVHGTKPTVDEIFSALEEVVGDYYIVYIVIDALDECRDSDGTRRQFLAKLRDLQAGHDVRLMATSRSISEIMNWFNEGLKLEVQASKEDVKRFVAGRMCELPKCIQRDPELQEVVQEKISEAVDGMFLLARLHTDSLLDKRTKKDVRLTLAKLSKGSAALDDAYKKAIQRIEGQLSGDYELAKTVLSWITYAKRPLTTTEICCALAVEPSDAELDPENVPDVEDLLSVCAGLVVVDQESAVIRLVHYTTQEYLERIQNKWNPGGQLNMASTCLTYLSFDIFKTGSCSSDEEFKERLRKSQFLDYAAKHWGEHASATEGETALILERRDSEDQTPLYLAAQLGHQKTVKLLLDKGAEVNAQGGEYGNALQAAAARNHTAIVELLLNNGADASRHDSQGKSILHYATNSVDCNLGLIDLLLSRGAPANTTDINNMTPLLYCVKHGHKSIIELFLDNGLSIDACANRKPWSRNTVKTDTLSRSSVSESESDISGTSAGLTPLHFAALTGNLAMTKFLLEHGADPNALSRYNESPMHLTLRRTLYGPSYDDDWTDKDFRIEGRWDLLFIVEEEEEQDAISENITKHREGVLDALLADTRTSPTIRDYQHNYPLHCVMYQEPESMLVIQKLVSGGANPLERNLKQQNALHLASQAGNHDAVTFLISLGVDPALTDNEGLNSLHYAAQSGNHETIDVILETALPTTPSLVASKDNQGRNALHHLASTNSRVPHETIQLLLDKGVGGSELDASGNSPLASYFKRPRLGALYVETCQSLLSVKGNALFVDKNGQNLGHLGALTFKCKVEVLEMLKEHGVDLMQRDLQGKTILHYFAMGGFLTKQSLHYLVHVVGIEIDAKDALGKTALQHAAEKARKDYPRDMFCRGRWDECVKLLSEHGASSTASRAIEG